jgi:RNA polymerase-binding transcription factor DksA
VRFDEQTRGRFRRALLNKGFDVATLLAEVLAGKDKERELAALPAFTDKPGLKPEERLRLFLDHIESRRLLLEAGDDRYGRCDSCGAELSALEMGEMPWADTCRACSRASG